MLKTFENRIERGFPYDHLRMPTSALATAIHTCICMHIYIYAYHIYRMDLIYIYIDLGKIDKIYNIFYVRVCVPKMARREPKMLACLHVF